jgi:hypothetical protein
MEPRRRDRRRHRLCRLPASLLLAHVLTRDSTGRTRSPSAESSTSRRSPTWAPRASASLHRQELFLPAYWPYALHLECRALTLTFSQVANDSAAALAARINFAHNFSVHGADVDFATLTQWVRGVRLACRPGLSSLRVPDRGRRVPDAAHHEPRVRAHAEQHPPLGRGQARLPYAPAERREGRTD